MITDSYEITEEPIGVPVTFAKASDWCRDIDVADTDLVNLLIDAANNHCESYTNRVFIDRTLIGKFSVLCESKFEPYMYVELRRSPLISVDEVRINDVVLDPSEYIVSESPTFARILFTGTISLDYTDTAYPIQVTFQAGYGDKDNQPSWVQVSIRQLVLFWYENRGDVSTDKKQLIPFVLKAVLNQHRIVNTYG